MTKYPLAWPAGWRRERFRRGGLFGKRGRGGPMQEISVDQAVRRVHLELGRLDSAIADIIISTNLLLRVDGLPRSDQKAPADPGAAVYWKRRKDQEFKVLAIDQYTRVADNLAAIAATLEAFRTVSRHGGAVILERAFTGFAALPSPNDWRGVMGFQPEEAVSLEQLRERYRKLAQSRHPDTESGSHAAMSQLNSAREQGEAELAQT